MKNTPFVWLRSLPVMPLPILFAVVLFPAGAHANIELVKDGRSQCLIVLADKPSATARAGARLLSSMLERVSGAKTPIVEETGLRDLVVKEGVVRASYDGVSPISFVFVGESQLAGKLGVSAEGLKRGGLRIKTTGNVLVLLGADDDTPADAGGSRYAVVTFLEEALGIRYLWPGELGLVVPRQPTIGVQELDKTFTPLITQRQIRWGNNSSDRTAEGLAYLGIPREEFDARFAQAFGRDKGLTNWSEWQRLGGSLELRGGHSFGDAWEKYHVGHPEWFALQGNGSRDLSKLNPERARLCKSNVELIEALAQDKIAELDRTGAKSISLAPNDGGRATFCMCSECKKLDPPEGRKITLTDYTASPPRQFEYVSLTDRMVWFWNRLATRISAARPGTWFVVYAYSAYKAPPIRGKLHPNIAVAFVGVSYDSDEARNQARADWQAWAMMSGKLYWRPNLLLYGRRQGVPAVYIHKLADDLQNFAHNGLVGTDFDSIMHNWATEGLNYYVLSKLLWDPDQDVDAILSDYCQSGFGPAAETVKRYFLEIERLTNQTAAGVGASTREIPSALKLAPYTPQTCTTLHALLNQALAAAGEDELIRQRIAFLRNGISFVELQARTHVYARAHQEQKPTSQERAQFMSDMEKKFQFMRRLAREQPLALNMPMISWGSEGLFQSHGWNGAKSLPRERWDADEDGRVVPPE